MCSMFRTPSLARDKHSINMSCCYCIDLDSSNKRAHWKVGPPTNMPKATRYPPKRHLNMVPASLSTDLYSTPTINMFNGVPLWHCPLPPLKFACHGLGLDTSM